MERRVRPVGGTWKRSFDCGTALTALVIMSPVMLMTALLVQVTMGRPILSSQQFLGFNRSIFTRWKFRTETVAEHEMPRAIADQPGACQRISWLGAIMVESGLDGLPQLFNIL